VEVLDDEDGRGPCLQQALGLLEEAPIADRGGQVAARLALDADALRDDVVAHGQLRGLQRNAVRGQERRQARGVLAVVVQHGRHGAGGVARLPCTRPVRDQQLHARRR
jgi:hypothetical protein